jgi:hypothetical protein
MRGFLARGRLSLVLAGVLLIPLAGVATGAGAAAASTSSKKCASPARAFSAPAVPSAFHTCLIDQYGNTYTFTIDSVHHSVYGTVANAQGCTPTWDLTGSYVKKTLELTAADPGSGDGCIDTYMLKGKYPNAEWYYSTGYGAQGFTYATCNKPGKPLHVLHGGARP